jgi:hypothetical protein
MMPPERRKARAALYAHLDPDMRMQPMGYDYLADDAGAVLERIAPGREYRPPHRDARCARGIRRGLGRSRVAPGLTKM